MIQNMLWDLTSGGKSYRYSWDWKLENTEARWAKIPKDPPCSPQKCCQRCCWTAHTAVLVTDFLFDQGWRGNIAVLHTQIKEQKTQESPFHLWVSVFNLKEVLALMSWQYEIHVCPLETTVYLKLRQRCCSGSVTKSCTALQITFPPGYSASAEVTGVQQAQAWHWSCVPWLQLLATSKGIFYSRWMQRSPDGIKPFAAVLPFW